MIIGFMVSNETGQSVIEFGGYDTKYLKHSSSKTLNEEESDSDDDEDDSLGLKTYDLYSKSWW